MDAKQQAEQELNVMLDEGITAAISEPASGSFVVRIDLADASCADCLVPDETLVAITTDALQRAGSSVDSLTVEHAG